jgi:hypothetical protein
VGCARVSPVERDAACQRDEGATGPHIDIGWV